MRYQLAVDCADPSRMAMFWADALGYRIADPPAGFDTWRAFYLSIGVAEEELGDGDCNDSIVDPTGAGPRVWFQQVPEGKVVKNRMHFDVLVGGGRSVPIEVRRERVDAEAERLVAAGATRLVAPDDDSGIDHYFAPMRDPEGNEFDIV